MSEWTTDKPTRFHSEPGWYWYRKDRACAKQCVRVYIAAFGDELWVLSIENTEPEQLSVFSYSPDAEWSTKPIEEPTDKDPLENIQAPKDVKVERVK